LLLVWGPTRPFRGTDGLKQRGELEEYIQDFDILWNKAEVSEKQALVIFLGGLETEIKNTVKMFKPKTFRHAYNLSRLQFNTQTYRKSPAYIRRPPTVFQHHSVPATITSPPHSTTNIANPHIAPQKPTPTLWTNNPGSNYIKTYIKPIKSIRNQDFEDRRLKGLCFWCDDKFVPGHRCKSKRVYSLSVLEEEEGVVEEEVTEDKVNERELTPHISLDALEGTVGLNTMKVNGKIEKTTVCILIDSGSTHNFLNTTLALKLQLQLTTIKPMIVQAANGEKMVCKSMCKGLEWKMQGISFQTDVYIIDLSNFEMVLGIQWLSMLSDILCNYKHLWMSFDWQGERVLLKGENPPKFQTIELKQLSSIVGNQGQVAYYFLCSLMTVDDGEEEATGARTITTLFPDIKDTNLLSLFQSYQDLFHEPKGLPPPKAHGHKIPLKAKSEAVNLRPYRYSRIQKDILEKMVKEMLEARIIRTSNSPFASPVILVKKKDSTWRFYVDYRALNKLTIKINTPFP
jgi:hypothetical protein